MAQRFALDPADVTWYGAASGGGRRKARYSRANALSSMHMTLRHNPTGIEVSGSVPEGYYARNEMQRLRGELYNRLHKELEQAVAQALRVPGR